MLDDEAVVGGLNDLRFGALALASGRLSPNRSRNPTEVGEGDACAGSGVRLPMERFRANVSIREKADDCWPCMSWFRACSYRRLVRVTLRSGAGVELVVELPVGVE